MRSKIGFRILLLPYYLLKVLFSKPDMAGEGLGGVVVALIFVMLGIIAGILVVPSIYLWYQHGTGWLAGVATIYLFTLPFYQIMLGLLSIIWFYFNLILLGLVNCGIRILFGK